MERTPNMSKHTKLILEKKILPPLLPGFELAAFRSRVNCKLSRLLPLISFQTRTELLMNVARNRDEVRILAVLVSSCVFSLHLVFGEEWWSHRQQALPGIRG